MSEKTVRIRTELNSNPYYLKFKLEQKFDFLDILSLKISQEDVYRKFCADYGVVVGRVMANDGFGIPNAKVSIFIPLDDVDSEDGLISGLYPYEHTTDKNDDGVRYNLLPKKRKNECHLPVGTFPNKREVLDNNILLEIYEKYYKFTTTTNGAGDFMLFGIPTGTHTLHMDIDVSDIGVATSRPYDLIRNGSVDTLFDSPTKFKTSNDLDSLRHIIKNTTSVDVKPFWGESEECEVGINRVDCNIPERIEPAAIFIGSVITDEDKHSINRRCRARYKTGKIEEMTTGAGSIEMIRKTIGGNIEYKSINGNRLIDDDGTWVYQVPMNLKPMVTDEFGNLVESEDPRKGLFSEADVRFRIKMDTTGGEGRLREKAEYLVPHNPSNETEIDYNFDANTKDESFFKMKWNKIYTVRNFIPRFQANIGLGVDNRNWLGIKNVDRGKGKNNFPYSRLDTDLNPIFTIIMSLLAIVTFIVYMLNSVIIPVINIIIYWINWVVGIIMSMIHSLCYILQKIKDAGSFNIGSHTVHLWSFNMPSWCNENVDPYIPYIGCITMSCDQQDNSGTDCDGNPQSSIFAPGCECCDCSSNDSCNDCGGNDGDCLLNAHDNNQDIDVHPVFNTESNGNVYPPGTIDSSSFKYLACVASGLANTFEMFTFDFYNDWVNGTLYHFLYKHKRNADKNSFCNVDYHCPNGTEAFCMENYLVDTSVQPQPDGVDVVENFFGVNLDVPMAEKTWETRVLSGGIIKNFDEHMYYVPFSSGHKLYATDITVLGSTKKCDVDGFPYIIDRIPTSSYTLGPIFDTVEVRCLDASTGTLETIVTESGIIGYAGDNQDGLFMNVNPLGLWVNYCQSRNVRLQSELGRNFDEEGSFTTIGGEDAGVNNMIGMLDTVHWNNYRDNTGTHTCNGIEFGPGGNPQPQPIEFTITSLDGPGSQDIFDEFVRYGLRGLNTPYAITNSTFDGVVAGEMYTNQAYEAHELFRGYNGDDYGAGDAEYGFGTNAPHTQPDVKGLPYNNSYYFYFGLIPAKSAIDKLHTRFLTDCDYVPENDFILNGNTTNVTIVSGTDGTLIVEILGGASPYEYEILGPSGYNDWNDGVTASTLTFVNLEAGNYIITVIDSTGGSARGVFEINEPDGLVASITATNTSGYGNDDGTIIINDVAGGTIGSGYQIMVTPPGATTTVSSFPHTYYNLNAGTYTITITDNAGGSIIETVTVHEPPEFNIAINWSDISCYNMTDGTINLSVDSGGLAPFTPLIVSPSNGYNSNTLNNGNLEPGNYVATIEDANGNIPSNVTVNGVFQSYIGSVSISMVNPVELDITPLGNLDPYFNSYLRCYGGTTNVSVNAIGDNLLYNVNGQGNDPVTGGVIQLLNVPYGQYEIKIYNANGCEYTQGVTIFDPQELVLTQNNVTDVTCYGGSTGKIKVDFSGGIPDSGVNWLSGIYHYKLVLTGPVNMTVNTNANTYEFDSLPTGSYTVKLYDYDDGNNFGPCYKEITTFVNEPAQLVVYYASKTDTSITVNPNGGTPAYVFKIDSGSYQSSPTFIGLTPSTAYTITVKDSHGCTSNIIITTNT